MIEKKRTISLKGLLIGLTVFFSITGNAQSLKIPLPDSALLSAAGRDAAFKTVPADSSVATLLMKLEERVIHLNKDLALLRRGFDTLAISEDIPVIEEGLNRLQASLAKMHSGINVRNLNAIKVALQQVQKMVRKHQETLNGYNKTLLEIGENQAKAVADPFLNQMPEDSTLKLRYLKKLNPVLQKSKTNDSLLLGALKAIALLQNEVTGSYLRCAELLEEVNLSIKNIQTNFFKRDAPFLWQAKSVGADGDFWKNIQLGFRRNIGISLYFLSLNYGVPLTALFLGMAFFFLNQVSIRKLRKVGSSGWDLPLHFLKNKIWLPTLLVIVTLLPFFMLNPPAGLVLFLWLLMLVAATLIRWQDWPVNFRRMWIGIIACYILFSFDSFLPEAAAAERVILASLNLGAIALAWYMHQEVGKDKSRYHDMMPESIVIFIIVNGLALLMNFGGRVNLARVLSNSAVLSITLLLALQIIREIILEFVYIQVEAYKHFSASGILEFNKMKEKFRTTLGVITIVLWLLALSWSLNLYDLIQEVMVNFLIKKRTLGEFNFTYSGILVFTSVIWLSMLAGKLVTFIFHGDESELVGSRKGKSGSLILFGKLGIYTIGILLAFAATGIGLDKMAIIVGALGVGIGFGLQNIVNNLVSGIILAIEKPMEIGDVIELGTRVGTVKEIGFRSSKISTFEGSVIIVPNGEFISQQLINWTHSNNNYRRVEIIVGVKYGSNLEQVKTIIDTIIQQSADVAKYPAPNIFVNEFANSSVNLRILFWTSDYDKWVVLRSKIFQDIYEAFTEHGIEIPFPQTDLHIRSIDPEVAKVLRGNSNQD